MDALNLHRLTRQKYAKTGTCTINDKNKKLFSLHVIDNMATQQAISFQHFNFVWKVEKKCLLILKMTIDYEKD